MDRSSTSVRHHSHSLNNTNNSLNSSNNSISSISSISSRMKIKVETPDTNTGTHESK